VLLVAQKNMLPNLLLIVLLQATLLVNLTHAASALPSIIWIMADDLGWGEPSAYPSTSSHGRIATPNLDKLANNGVRFTNAYAGYTVCAPSRTTLFTGRHSGKFKEYNLPGTSLAPSQAVTTAQLLKEAGYATALVGKSAPLTAPLQQGFDYFFGQVNQAQCHNMYPRVIDYGNETGNINLTLNYKMKNRELCMASPEEYNYTTDLFQHQALTWLESAAKDADVTPFFLYLSFTVPHAGGWSDTNKESGAPVPTDGRYQNQTSWPLVERDHAGVITYLDNYVGQVMTMVESLNIEENTLLFFASDNGAHLEGGHSYKFFNSTGGLRGHKRSMFEGGVRSPTMVMWKGTIKAGTVSDYPWSFWDVMPTLAEIAGVAQENLPKKIDGHSILPTLLGDTQAPPSYIYYTGNSGWGKSQELLSQESSQELTKSKTTSYSIRVGNMKAVVSDCQGKPTMKDTMQLFNLDVDPFETTDISGTRQKEVKELKKFIIGENVSCACYQC